MAEVVLQGIPTHGDVAKGSAIRVLGAIGMAVARGASGAFRVVSSVIQLYRPVAQGFLMGSSTVPASRVAGQC